jgi:hypothetical protein
LFYFIFLFFGGASIQTSFLTPWWPRFTTIFFCILVFPLDMLK